MANSFFEFKQFIIHQDQCAFKVTTDASILGAYPNIPPPETICDIGTGTGVLSLMMAQKFSCAKIDAVEIDPLSAQQARENIKLSSWDSRIAVFNESIQDFKRQKIGQYDMIICNPPYYEDQLWSENQRKNLARHNYKLSLSELVEYVSDILNETGFFYSILPPQSFKNLEAGLLNKGFNLFDKLDIFNAPGKPLYRVIGGFCKKLINKENKSLTIYNTNGDYSVEFKTLLKDFYLAF